MPILNKRTDQRTPQDIETLIPLIKRIDFFQERDIKEHDLFEIANCLKYEYHKKSQLVFDYSMSILFYNAIIDQPGDKFYIILGGTVSVQIPIKRKKIPTADNEIQNKTLPIQDPGKSSLGMNNISEKIKMNPRLSMIGQRVDLLNSMMSQQNTSEQANSQKPSLQQQKRVSLDDAKLSQNVQAILKNKQDRLQNRNSNNQESLSNFQSMDTLQIINEMENSQSVSNNNIGESKREEDVNISKSSPYKSRDSLPDQDSLEDQQELDDSVSNLHDIKNSRKLTHQKPEENEDHGEEETVFIEVAQLTTGKSFGELALITNKPRAARIQCLTECHFAIMTKQEYTKSLAKIENKNRLRTIQFFSDIPFFAQWSKTQLGKLIASFQFIKYKRGHLLFKEGQANEDIFIVRNGEFSGIRTMVMKSANQSEPVMQYLRGERTNKSLRTSFNPQINSLTKVQAITNTAKTREQIQVSLIREALNFIQLFLFGKGQIFGEERFIRNEKIAPYTAICSSLDGEVMRISSIEFLRKIFSVQETAELIKQNTRYKEDKIAKKQLAGLVYHENKNSISKPNNVVHTQKGTESSNFNKFLIQQRDEKRETLKEIVSGYPGVKKVQDILKEEEQAASRKESLHNSLTTSLQRNLDLKILNSFRISQRNYSEIPPNYNLRPLTTDKNISQDAAYSYQTRQIQTTKKLRQVADKSRTGNKVYVSSHLVDAIVNMRNHNLNKTFFRNTAKEKLQDLTKRMVIDENSVAIYDQSDDYQDHLMDETMSNMSMTDKADNMIKSEFTRTQTLQSESGMNIISAFKTNPFKSHDKNASILGHSYSPSGQTQQTEMYDEEKEGAYKEFFTKRSSKKSFKSYAINDRNRKQSITIHQDEIVALPNKSFYGSNGTQIKVLGGGNQKNNEFSPLIQYLVNQRNSSNETHRQTERVTASENRSKKIMADKTVFMHVAETLQRGKIIQIRKNPLFRNSMLPTLTKYQ